MEALVERFRRLDFDKILQEQQAHLQIYPKEHLRYIPPKDARHSAVFVTLIELDATPHTVLIRRTDRGKHGGQIALPGGALEPEDASIEAAGYREFREEVGVEIDETLGQMTPLYIPVSDYMLTPYIGAIGRPDPYFTPEPSEVAEILLPSIDEVIKMQLSTRTLVVRSQKMTVRGFQYSGHFIWGATAMVMAEFQILCKIARDA